jgi:hypothetical protein
MVLLSIHILGLKQTNRKMMWVDHMYGMVMITYQKRILKVFIQAANDNESEKLLAAIASLM